MAFELHYNVHAVNAQHATHEWNLQCTCTCAYMYASVLHGTLQCGLYWKCIWRNAPIHECTIAEPCLSHRFCYW